MKITKFLARQRPRALRGASRRVVTATALAGAALLVVGCAPSPTSSSGAAAGTLTIYQPSPPSSLNPARNQGPTDAQFADLLYGQMLYGVTPDDYRPELAKSVEYIGSDNRHFRIVLKPNILFSDGTPLTAEIEAKSIKFSIKEGGVGPDQFPLDRIETPDSSTVDIYFTKPYPFALAQFSQQGGVGSPISEKGMNGGDLGFQSYGAGAYQLDTSATQAGSAYTLVKNPHYFEPSQQKWDKIVFKVLANGNSAIQAAASSSNAYAAGSVLQNDAAKQAGLRIAPVAETKTYGLLIADRQGQVSKPLGNAQVRQALNYAVNREPDAKALLGSPTEQLNGDGFTGHYSPDIYSYDIAKAKSLLASAGYADGFTFQAVVNGADPTSVKAAQLFVADLAKINVTVDLVTATTQAAFLSNMMSQKYPAAIDQLPGNVLAFLPATLQKEGFFNFFHNPEPFSDYTAKYDAASKLQGDAADKAWGALNRELQQDYVWLVELAAVAPSYYSSQSVIVPKTYGLTPNPLYFEYTS